MSNTSLIHRARLFKFYSQYLWRFHRVLVRKYLSKRCANCSISHACFPLGENGLCSECREAKPGPAHAAARESASPQAAELDALLRGHAGKGTGLFDALVMLSGGKDSALLLHELRQRFPQLRLLAFTIDNSFMSPVALQNARTTADKLDIDHVVLKPPRSLYVKSFRLACTLREAGKGCFETVDRIDADLGFSLAKVHAATCKIPLVITGLSWAQVERLFDVPSFEIPREQALAKVTATLGRKLDRIFAPTELKYWWDPARFPGESWPRFIHPFHVWRREEGEIQKQVVQLGLIEPGNDSPLLTNNVLIPMMIVVDYLRQGYASFEPEFARLIREGKADRRTWRNVFEMLEYSAKTGWMLDAEIDKIATSLGLSRADIGLIRSRSNGAASRHDPVPGPRTDKRTVAANLFHTAVCPGPARGRLG